MVAYSGAAIQWLSGQSRYLMLMGQGARIGPARAERSMLRRGFDDPMVSNATMEGRKEGFRYGVASMLTPRVSKTNSGV